MSDVADPNAMKLWKVGVILSHPFNEKVLFYVIALDKDGAVQGAQHLLDSTSLVKSEHHDIEEPQYVVQLFLTTGPNISIKIHEE